MDRRSLLLRVLTAVVGIPLLLGAAWLGGWWWVSVVLVVFTIAVNEYATLNPSVEHLSLTSAMVGGGGALTGLFLSVRSEGHAGWVWFAVTVLYAGGIFPPVITGNAESAGLLKYRFGIFVIGWTYLGVAAAVLAYWGYARQFPVILWLFAVIWANDIAAYFVGHALGRHKLAPQLSPAKSWEGAAAGLVAGAAASIGFASWLSVAPVQAAAAGAAVTVASQLGDLFESAVKRRAGVKDSGVIFPGHGGVLDRFDGVFAAAPVAYLLLQWWAR